MRKLVAIISVVAMLMAIAVPAMANPSIKRPWDPKIDEKVTVGGQEYVIVSTFKLEETITDEDALAVIKKVNDPEDYVSVQEVHDAMKPSEEEQYKAPDGLKHYHFTTDFAGLEVKGDSGIMSLGGGFTVTFVAPDMSKEGVLYYIMFIDANGVVYYIPLDPTLVDENGMVTFTFPDLGAFAIIEKPINK